MDDNGGPSNAMTSDANKTVGQPTNVTTKDICQVTRDVFSLAAGAATNAVSRKMLEKVGNLIERKARLFEGLEKILPPPIPGVARGPKRVRDQECIWISEWCEVNGFKEWGMRPRTFVILHLMGCPEALDGFVEEKLYDIALPYTEENLPRVIRGGKRKEFIDYQQHVLTAHAKDLEESGQHQNVEGSADSFFWPGPELGSGGFGIVDHVFSRQSLHPFARKRIPRGRSFKKDRETIRMFENELKNLKSLSHMHLVKLIGSYTDRKYVGLIMTPVAEMDLDTFLSSPRIDPVDRQSCLRRFYGCLATAVEYLHQQKLRHKDIKPKNVLVKNRQVLLTDFGTSHNWADDARSTTSGTNKQAFTKAYCAPEVYMHGSRNPSSDIWSLGCVFFDMSTVLAGFTIADRKAFFQGNGNNGFYVRDNAPATKLWIEEHLMVQASRPEDNQVLDLFQSMCHIEQTERPTATEVVSLILDFEGPPYYGFCCDRNDTHRSSGQDPDNTTTFYDNDTITARPSSSASSRNEAPRMLLGIDASYEPPSVQEIEDGMTIQDIIPGEKSSSTSDGELSVAQGTQDEVRADAPESSGKPAQDSDELTTSFESTESTPDTSPQTPMQKVLPESYLPPAMQEVEDGMTIRHLIPDMETLRMGMQKHAIHDQSSAIASAGAKVPGRKSDNVEAQLPTSTSSPDLHWRPFVKRPWKFSKQNTLLCPWPLCEFEAKVEQAGNLKLHLRSTHGVHELSWTTFLPDVGQSTSGSRMSVASPQATDSFAQKLRSAVTSKRAAIRARTASRPSPTTSTDWEATLQVPPRKSVRFGGLPEELRPAAQSPDDGVTSQSIRNGIQLEHLDSQHVDQLWQLSRDGQRPAGTDLKIPDSSLVPSFFLASTNLFSKQEVNSFTRLTRFGGFGPRPLFVCGSLMFPSVLKARAEAYMSSEGVYSERLQRRLRTNATDWAKINVSLQQAAESMTPALIKDHYLCKRHGLSPSILLPSYYAQNNHVSGLLIFGLSEDALACLDHMFSVEAGRDMFTDSTRASWPRGASFERRPVNASITLKGGEGMFVEAEAFIANGFRDEEAFSSQVDLVWDVNLFARGRSFRRLSSNHTGEAPWVDEEEELARAMRIKFILHGDALCDAVVAEDKDEILYMIDKKVDVNAPCHTYGTALQAAAFKGNENVVDLLIRQGARINAKGGQYQNALIAATVKGHESVARLLLKNGADVLADGGRYISALYQAVDFSDQELAQTLLEKGAWLSPNYRELLDLASEHGNRDMTRLLEEYDVRMLHLKPNSAIDGTDTDSDKDSDVETIVSPAARTLGRSRDNPGDRVAINKAALVKQVGFKIMVLKGQKGKWTGIKGVQIFRAAIQAGMDESIIDRARPHLRVAQNILDWLMKAVNEMNEENMESERRRRRTITDGVERGRGNRRRSNGIGLAQDAVASLNRPTQSARRNTVPEFPLPNYSSTRLPTYSSLNLAPPNAAGPAPLLPSNTNSIICLTCEGRGGRLGTEHRCHICGGSGRPRRRSDGNRPVTGGREDAVCVNCAGKGVVYSNRDRCGPCGGSGGAGGGGEEGRAGAGGNDGNRNATGAMSQEGGPGRAPLGGAGGVVGGQNDPPPPYTMT